MNAFQKPHVVAVPFPALGHSIPFLDLSRLLASHGLTVSYVTTPANVSRLEHPINEAVSNGLDIRLVVLPTPPVEGLPQGRESSDLLPRDSNALIFQLAQDLQQPFQTWMERQFEEQGTGSPVCVIHDLFIGWGLETAQKHNICRVLFNPCGAFAISLLHSASCSISENGLQTEGDSVVLYRNLPRPLRFYKHEISPNSFNPDYSKGSVQKFVQGRVRSIGEDSGMLINTFHELEPEYLQHLEKLRSKPVWAIGPLLPPEYFSGEAKVKARGKMADVSEEELVGWLESQNEGSVLYVSFGSQTYLSEQQTIALSRGLEGSEQPFVWAIKVPPTSIEPATCDSTAYLPEGFQERTKDRGLVIWGWAPQLLILSHPSVGAFMSHCGWNSTLESLTLGVPLISWPMFGDQHFDSKLVAELGVGIQFCQHRDGIPDEQRVKEVVRLVLNGERGKEMKMAAEKLKEMARKAVDDGGSSNADLQAFVSEMQNINIRAGKNSKRDTEPVEYKAL